MTPYEKLKSLGYTTSQEFCLFPTLILDRLVDLPEIVNYQKSVQEHLDYDLRKPHSNSRGKNSILCCAELPIVYSHISQRNLLPAPNAHWYSQAVLILV